MKSNLGFCFILLSSFLISSRVQGDDFRKLTLSESLGADLLGFSTSLHETTAYLGAPAGRIQPGVAFLYDAQTGAVKHTLTPSQPRRDDFFGFDGDLDGTHVIVGDPANPRLAIPPAGAVYVFDVNTGTELRRVQPNDSSTGDEFGFSTSIDGSKMLIGAPHLGEDHGSAYIIDVNTGSQLHKLSASDSVAGNDFGWDLAIEGDYAVVGAPGNFDTLGLVAGDVYVFNVNSGAQLGKLIPNRNPPGDEFGFSIGISDGIAIVGAPDAGVGEGSAFLFDLATRQQTFRLRPDDSALMNDFGSSVDIFGNLAVVGARGANNGSGAGYVFDVTTGQQVMRLSDSTSQSDDRFGTAISIYGEGILVGSPNNDDPEFNAGAGYVFGIDAIEGIPGDFDNDGSLTSNDLELQKVATLSGIVDSRFDLNNDNKLDFADRRVWVDELSNTFFGDANLDGMFDTTDLIKIFQAGEYEDNVSKNSTWEEGDWNGDCEFDTTDLILVFQEGAFEMGPRAGVSSVPEPASLSLLVMGLLFVVRRRK